jgi:hypothetical protein
MRNVYECAYYTTGNYVFNDYHRAVLIHRPPPTLQVTRINSQKRKKKREARMLQKLRLKQQSGLAVMAAEEKKPNRKNVKAGGRVTRGTRTGNEGKENTLEIELSAVAAPRSFRINSAHLDSLSAPSTVLGVPPQGNPVTFENPIVPGQDLRMQRLQSHKSTVVSNAFLDDLL